MTHWTERVADMSEASDEWAHDKARGLLDATGEEYKAATGFNNASEAMGHSKPKKEFVEAPSGISQEEAKVKASILGFSSGTSKHKSDGTVREELRLWAQDDKGRYVLVAVIFRHPCGEVAMNSDNAAITTETLRNYVLPCMEDFDNSLATIKESEAKAKNEKP